MVCHDSYGNKNYAFYSIDKVMMIENGQFATVTTCEHDMLSGVTWKAVLPYLAGEESTLKQNSVYQTESG